MLDPSKPVEETFNLCPVHAADQLTEEDVLWMITNSLSTCLISTNTDLHEVYRIDAQRAVRCEPVQVILEASISTVL